MALTRTETIALVKLNTGRTDKDTLIDSLCDTALKVATTKHAFQDSMHICDDLTITEDATSVAIAATDLKESTVQISGDLVDIVTARIVEASGTRNAPLIIKNKTWWDKNVVNPEDNQKGWPNFGLHFGTNILLDGPATSGLELRLRTSHIPVFASDATECPIKILDTFVEQYTTAMVFLSLSMNDKYIHWYIMALGRNYDRGEVGGTLLAAITKDRSLAAEDKNVERGSYSQRERGVSVQNLIAGADRYGETHSWY